jgi:hypothetical protein
MRLLRPAAVLILMVLSASVVRAEPEPNGAPGAVEFPHVRVDVNARQIRVECETLAVPDPLEFFCVTRNGPEHEAVLRTDARPSHIHAALLMLGLEPGSPMKFVEARQGWTAPFGPPVRVSVEYKTSGGQVVIVPAERLMRGIRSQKPMPPTTWIFAGSRQTEDGQYLADATGYVVSIVNFEMTLIDVPRLASSANATLEWEYAANAGPARGTPVTMILEPVLDAGPAAEPANAEPPTDGAQPDELAALRSRWRAAVHPHRQALRDAAQTHFDTIAELKAKQARLIDEADRLQRLIDDLEREYNEMTAPKPKD